LYAFNENFVLPLSHDEVVHGKGSLLRRMAGDEWQKLAALRTLFGYTYAQPGKKLLFMGGEIAQWNEWYHETSLDWHLLTKPEHEGMQKWIRDLNRLYREVPALHGLDCDPEGFEWVDVNDAEASVVSFVRRDESGKDLVLAAFNFTPVPRHNYRLGVPRDGFWEEVLNSDSKDYGGTGQGNLGGVEAAPVSAHGRDQSLLLVVPPLSASIFRHRGDSGERR
ncbi:MAG: alpha amylase C-terminal domain-containing protein, partial [Vicinamibacteria bacterium]